MPYITRNPRPIQPRTVSQYCVYAPLGYLAFPHPCPTLSVAGSNCIDSSIFGQWIQVWLRARMLWHSTSNFSGYISDFCRLLSRLESDYPLKCHNRAPYAYVITVPHFVYQCLILLLTGYIALSVMCNHALILCQPKAAWSATLLKHAKMFHANLFDANKWRLTRYLHYASVVYELFMQPLFRYAVLEWFYGW